MKLKKLLIFILAMLVASAALCACGGDAEGNADVDSNGSVYDSYASSSDETQVPEGEENGGESSGLNENYFQSSVML